MEKAKEKSEQLATRSQSEYHEHAQGWNYYFIMLPWSDEGVAWKEVERHGMHVCPKQYGRDCLVCKELRKRIKKGDTDFVDENRSKTQGYFNAIRKSDIKKGDPDCIKVLRASPTVFGEIIDFITDEEIDITDPEAAHVVGIKRTGTGMRTRYKTKVSSEAVDISRYITDKVLEGLFDLDTIRAVQPASDKDLRKLVRGSADDDEDDDFSDDDLDDDKDGDDDLEDDLDDGDDIEDELFDDDEEEPAEEEAEEEPEEEVEDDFDFEDEEEEAPPPKRTKKKVAKKAPAKKVRRRRA